MCRTIVLCANRLTSRKVDRGAAGHSTIPNSLRLKRSSFEALSTGYFPARVPLSTAPAGLPELLRIRGTVRP